MPACLRYIKPRIIGDALPANNLRHMRPWSVFSVAALAGWLVAATLLGTAAQASEPVLTPYSDSPELKIEALSGATPRLRLQGVWPTPCLPSVEQVRLDGSDLRIELRSKKPLCARASVPFDLEVDLARWVGKQWPAAPLRVSVLAANSVTAETQLRGFALIAPQPGPRAIPASGLWWPLPEADASNPMAGTGFSFEVQGN
ncbi:MAG TPA: hypothetical protein VN153_00800, partial [Tahibacter sp.]|nr:hypothetical protein [Tahibacter sp.]